jgi:hypothetical protein
MLNTIVCRSKRMSTWFPNVQFILKESTILCQVSCIVFEKQAEMSMLREQGIR